MDIMKWTYDERTVRTAETDDGKVLFCGKDVAEALGYTNPRDALTKHCRCVAKRDVPHPQSPDKTIEMTFIPESDVYRLAFGSKLPTAERFTDWVTEEVLPAIRRNGSYGGQLSPMLRYLAGLEQQQTAQQRRMEEQERRIAFLERQQQCMDVFEQQCVIDAVQMRSLELLGADADPNSTARIVLLADLYAALKERFNVSSYVDLLADEVSEALRFIGAWEPGTPEPARSRKDGGDADGT